ncbi:hypothetical protein [Cutibacterium modestum]|uniref:hypothetical protein n=1 Tax=Cutibacterium modestum TaxID=2559073 RepID=UPI0020A34425|nr:hypothetical protein [Cutibacterium modestum]
MIQFGAGSFRSSDEWNPPELDGMCVIRVEFVVDHLGDVRVIGDVAGPVRSVRAAWSCGEMAVSLDVDAAIADGADMAATGMSDMTIAASFIGRFEMSIVGVSFVAEQIKYMQPFWC